MKIYDQLWSVWIYTVIIFVYILLYTCSCELLLVPQQGFSNYIFVCKVPSDPVEHDSEIITLLLTGVMIKLANDWDLDKSAL